MKLVYTHDNQIMVANIANYLMQNNIEVVIRNQYASGGVGEIPPIEAWPEVFVLNDNFFSKAINLINELNKDLDEPKWLCKKCNEINYPTFDYCWNCQQENY